MFYFCFCLWLFFVFFRFSFWSRWGIASGFMWGPPALQWAVVVSKPWPRWWSISQCSWSSDLLSTGCSAPPSSSRWHQRPMTYAFSTFLYFIIVSWWLLFCRLNTYFGRLGLHSQYQIITIPRTDNNLNFFFLFLHSVKLFWQFRSLDKRGTPPTTT